VCVVARESVTLYGLLLGRVLPCVCVVARGGRR